MARSAATPIVGLLIFFSLMAGLGITGWKIAEEQERARTRWVPVDGRVVAASIEVEEEHDEYHYIYYYPRLTYAYHFAGRAWTGRHIHVHDNRSHSEREQAQAVLDRFPLGQTITVFVDPDDPARATLLFDASSMPYLLCLISAVFTSLPLVVLLMQVPSLLRTIGLLLCTVAWYSFLGLVVSHWWRNCNPTGLAWIFVWSCFLLFAGLGLVLATMSLGSLLTGKNRSIRPTISEPTIR